MTMKIYVLRKVALAGLAVFVLMAHSAFAGEPFHHNLRVDLNPVSKFANIKDTIQFKTSGKDCGPFTFLLHGDLKLTDHKVSTGWHIKTFSIDQQTEEPRLLNIEIEKSATTPCPEKMSMELAYSGVLYDPEADEASGLFLSGASYFYPQANEDYSLITFEMQVSLPKSWQAVSQGRSEGNKVSEGSRTVFWESSMPSEEIYLIANRFHIYEVEHKGLSLVAYLLKEEKQLADRYLETAKGYIDFYSELIGPYPYEKFALIENSRQTGYGMPSFTLMGSRIIRFPFILHSSYPHEILHNWWGNGVFPDLQQGNWSEGLTAYLADHLLLELKGKGAQYRFQEMMKFSNYVNSENDFPLNIFRYRDSMASQAIGYAKLLMVFHMLRTEIGDENFLKGLKRFYVEFKYRYAGYEELRKTFEKVSGRNLTDFFGQWVTRKGAPEIKLKDASYVANKDRYDLKLTVEQASQVFQMKLPVAIWTTASPTAEIHYVELNLEKQDFNIQLSAEPVAVRLDPYNDVFRLPGKEEAPPNMGKAYGAKTITAVLSKKENISYQKFAQSIAKPGSIISGDEKANYPKGSLWVFGQDHPMKKTFIEKLKKSGVEITKQGVGIQGGEILWKNHSFVFTLNRSDEEKGTMTWVVTDNAESIPGLMRKLPHYGKYGYLVFEGNAPDNRIKGAWPSNPKGLQKVFKKGQPQLLPEQKSLVSFKPFP